MYYILLIQNFNEKGRIGALFLFFSEKSCIYHFFSVPLQSNYVF